MTTAEIEATIKREIEASVAEGWEIHPGMYRVRYDYGLPNQPGACCAIGAVGRKADDLMSVVAYAESALDVAPSWISSFVEGFDENPLHSPASPVPYDLGKQIRVWCRARGYCK